MVLITDATGVITGVYHYTFTFGAPAAARTSVQPGYCRDSENVRGGCAGRDDATPSPPCST